MGWISIESQFQAEISKRLGRECCVATAKVMTERYGVFTVAGDAVAIFHVSELPGCCGIGVVNGYSPGSLAAGAEDLIVALGEEIVGLRRYTIAYSTNIRSTTVGKNHINAMLKRGWKEIDRFQNENTGNIVYAFRKDVSEFRPEEDEDDDCDGDDDRNGD